MSTTARPLRRTGWLTRSRFSAVALRSIAASRSHAILRYTLRDAATGSLLGMLRVVDLAGSERKKHVWLHGKERQDESKSINWSLGCLKECIRDQFIRETANPEQHIKYRNCKLTLLLKECFTSPKHRTVLIACLSPLIAEYESTRSTLDYARQLKVVEDSKAKAKAAAGAGAGAGGKKPKVPIERWTKKKVAGFIGSIEGGRFAEHQAAFSQVNGKALVNLWLGDFANKCGGNEADGTAIYDAVSAKKAESKKIAAAARRAAKAAEAGAAAATPRP